MTTPVSDMWGNDLSGTRGSVAVIGLGYIGLPTAVVLAHNGWDVTGVDVRPEILASVAAGELPFFEEGLADLLRAAVDAGRLRAVSEIPSAQRYVIAVPTPMTPAHEAELAAVRAVFEQVAGVLKGGETVILESTSPTGTTREMAELVARLRPDLVVDGLVEAGLVDGGVGAAAGGTEPVYVAYAPERVLPGRIVAELHTNDRIVGGLSGKAAERAAALYRSFCRGEVLTTTAPTAELVKLSENAFRDVNIAFANELSLIADAEGVDVYELIRLANRHPRVKILQPGPGVGGHCIAIDPWFIVQRNPELARLIRTAREVNDSKPHWVVDKLGAALGRFVGSGLSPHVALLGLTFKPDVDDVRQSPALEIARLAARRFPGANFVAIDPHVRALPADLEAAQNVALEVDAAKVRGADVVVFLVAHREFAALREAIGPDTEVLDVTGMWHS
ncbi:MAG: UDP-N-acetyl-D-mannosamine dehydrogenase [Ancrocorticia sp.]